MSADRPADADATAGSPPCVWLPGIAERVASFLPRNFVATTFRLLDRARSNPFSTNRTVYLSQPVPRWALEERWLAPDACKGLTLEQRWRLVQLVAASGDVGNLQVALTAAGCVMTEDVLLAAAKTVNLKAWKRIYKILRLRNWEWRGVLPAAASGGNRAICRWCLWKGAPGSWRAVAAAYRGGHPELENLLKPGANCPWGNYGQPGTATVPDTRDRAVLLQGAAEGCGLATLQTVWGAVGEQLAAEDPQAVTRALSCAVGSPTPDWQAKAEFLLSKGASVGPSSAQHAFSLPPKAALQRLAWLKARGCPPLQEAIRPAIQARQLLPVQWLLAGGSLPDLAGGVQQWPEQELEGRCPPLEVVRPAVEAGKFKPAELVGWLLELGAEGLPTLRWLLDTCGAEVLDPEAEGCSWSFETAVEAGCTDAMLLVLVRGEAYGFDVDESTWEAVARSGCLEWLAQVECPQPDDGRPYNQAARNGDVRTLRVLRRLGLPWGDNGGVFGPFAYGLRGGLDPGTLRWMLAEGCPVDWCGWREPLN